MTRTRGVSATFDLHNPAALRCTSGLELTSAARTLFDAQEHPLLGKIRAPPVVQLKLATLRTSTPALTRGECSSFDVLLWLSAAVLVLLPVVADVTNVSGRGDPDTLYPTILSVAGIMGLLAWDVRSVWSRVHRRAVSDGG